MASWPDLSYIRTELRYTLDESTASLWSDTELDRYINDAQRDIAIKTGCYTDVITVTTTIGSRLVPFVGHKVDYAEYVPAPGIPKGLIFITPKMLGNVSINDGIIPQYCFQWGQSLVIEPIPQAEYTINLYLSHWPEYKMYADTDEPVIPAQFHEAIPLFAATVAMIKAKRPMTASMFYKMYLSSLELNKAIYIAPRIDKIQDTKLPDVVEEGQNVQPAES